MSGHFPIPSGLAIFVPTREVSSLHLLAGAPITLHPTNVCLLVRCLLQEGGQVPIISGAFPSLLPARQGGGRGGGGGNPHFRGEDKKVYRYAKICGEAVLRSAL